MDALSSTALRAIADMLTLGEIHELCDDLVAGAHVEVKEYPDRVYIFIDHRQPFSSPER